MSKKDNKINDDISNLMAQGVNESTAVSTGIDVNRKKKKGRNNIKKEKFYEFSPWDIEADQGRVKTGRVGFAKKPKMRHGAY